MAGKSDTMADLVLNMLAAGTFPSVSNVPATTGVALLHTNPTDDSGTGSVETTYTNYTRMTIVSTSTGWNAPVDGTGETRVITNKLLITFPTAGATGDTGINGFAITFHTTVAGGATTVSGEILYWGSITGAPKVINASDPVSIAAGALTISED